MERDDEIDEKRLLIVALILRLQALFSDRIEERGRGGRG